MRPEEKRKERLKKKGISQQQMSECDRRLDWWRGPVKLNNAIKMVHGKETVAGNSASFEAMAENYGVWLRAQQKQRQRKRARERGRFFISLFLTVP